jgi:uncharacterized membrane-anchored protein
MDDDREPKTAIDAARCLYLAGVAQRLGHRDAAHRWQTTADLWMKRLEGDNGRHEQNEG